MSNAAIAPLLPVYPQPDFLFESGEGCWLTTTDGRRYLDFTAGIAVNALGHCHPHLVEALQKQASKLWHTSNLYRIGPTEQLAERLIAASFADTAFICNSGAEAVECAIKMARRYHFHHGEAERTEIVTFGGSFHGRTLATISAAQNPKHIEGFGPLLPGFRHIDFADHEALKDAITDRTAAVLIEPVMGEGGIRPVPVECLQGLRQQCDETGTLLIFDEIQCGMGRTGALFRCDQLAVYPDILASAKGLGGGFPIGACLATAKAAVGMVPGTHGTTFGGNPLATATANAVLNVMLEDGFFDHVEAMSTKLSEGLADLCASFPDIVNHARGAGLMLGVVCVVPAGQLIEAARDVGLLLVPAGDNVVRLLPPLVVSAEDISVALEKLTDACKALQEMP